MKLVASLIVKNELDRYLELCVRHLQTYCDEIRVLDDYSDDGSYEWLQEQEKVFVKVNESEHFYEHEGRARNSLLQWTLAAEPDFVLSIDADEFVGDPAMVRHAVNRGRHIASLAMEEVWVADGESLSIRVDGHWGPHQCPILWFAPRNLRGGQWEIQDKKLNSGREPIQVRYQRSRPTGTSVFHFGWARRAERPGRAERYELHDKGRFHLNAHLKSILWPDTKVVLRSRAWPPGMHDIRDELVARAARR